MSLLKRLSRSMKSLTSCLVPHIIEKDEGSRVIQIKEAPFGTNLIKTYYQLRGWTVEFTH